MIFGSKKQHPGDTLFQTRFQQALGFGWSMELVTTHGSIQTKSLDFWTDFKSWQDHKKPKDVHVTPRKEAWSLWDMA